MTATGTNGAAAPLVTSDALELMKAERGDDGLWHVVYPSATATLCGRVRPLVGKPGRTTLPTCGPCSLAARRIDRIDHSMPEKWRGL